MLFCVLLFLTTQVVSSYKIVMFIPNIADSQIIFNVRIAERLADAGHNVTIALIKMKKVEKERKFTQTVKIWSVNAYVFDEKLMGEEPAKVKYKDVSIFGVFNSIREKLAYFPKSCELLLQNKEFLRRLKKGKFDVAFAPMFDFCPIGVIHYAGIKSWIWLNTGRLMDYVAQYMGVPSPSSYVPPVLSGMLAKMTFFERVKSFIGWTITTPIFETLVAKPETALFRKYIDPNFADLTDIARKCPLVMVNTNELYIEARPTLHKIINIGGIGMKAGNTKPFEGELKTILHRAKNVVVMSFGSHANSSVMPDSWKDAFLNSFKKFEDFEFIIRYISHDLDDKKPENVHLLSWIPQTDLIHHEKTRILITHGGYNSVQEAIYAGLPIICLPLFGDQFTNSRQAVSLGFAKVLHKSEISEEVITEAIVDVLKNPKYAEAAKRMQRMVLKKPESAEQLIVRWTEFLAEFKTLDNLEPYGVHLNFIQYYCFDVIAVLFLILFLILIIIWKAIPHVLYYCMIVISSLPVVIVSLASATSKAACYVAVKLRGMGRFKHPKRKQK